MRRRTPSEPLRSYQRREQINEKKNRKDQRDIDHPCPLTIVASDFVAGFEKKDAQHHACNSQEKHHRHPNREIHFLSLLVSPCFNTGFLITVLMFSTVNVRR